MSGVCTAKKNCPLGENTPHGVTVEEAAKNYETHVANAGDPATNAFASFKKNNLVQTQAPPTKSGAPAWFSAAFDSFYSMEGAADKYYSDLLVSTDHLGEDQEKFLKQAAESGLANGGFPAEYIARVSNLWKDLGPDSELTGEGVLVGNSDSLSPADDGGYLLGNQSGEYLYWFENPDDALAASDFSPDQWGEKGGEGLGMA